MRASTVVALTLAASASILAPALARPAATSRIGYEASRIGHPVDGAFHANRDEALAARALQFPMPGEQSRWNAMWHHGRAEAASDSEAISFGKIIKGALHFLKREDDMVARAFEDELLARGHEEYHEMNHAPSTYNHAHTYAQHSARAFDDELYARADAAEGSEALNVGKLLKGVLHFLKREDPMVARAFEDELLARGHEGFHVGYEPTGLHYAGHHARAFDDELLARANAAEGSEAINFGKIVKGVFHFFKREDPMLACTFPKAEPINYADRNIIPTNYLLKVAREFEDELMARADGAEPKATEGSEALNLKWLK
ncbi:uncharacterized protein LAESUDRAFT_761950 [Laetiporus sulphureus 93-53]|uniref:Uncharacterized protein n=1 Tax=Laetiporus sulphureus 93-53 TaxID=1314785 RepID=A0A165CSQ8_9APHY|nr:uncharacterized protein LAESUDRAFT_761950 [Laetiporus sulphureus 93-53]KZT03371.1 hypothetical protein LAESUDRAFT_761950 [Laetiporus sulphureus 93-53]